MSGFKSPLRYPGGKQRLTPFIEELLAANGLVGGDYVEPYAGGAGVAIQLLLASKVRHIHLNDSCTRVYSFWKAALDHTEAFCRRIRSASLTVREWRKQKEILTRPSEFDVLDLGFSMFFLNRCNRSGILTGGVIGGLDQTGEWKMDARFPREDLAQRIQAIGVHRDSISVTNLDAETFIKDIVPGLPRKTFVYCDPPYFAKADRLYLNHYKPADHSRIAQVIQSRLKRKWAVSYDDSVEIANLYCERRSFRYQLQYNASKAYLGTELFFFSDSVDLPATSKIPSIAKALTGIPGA